MIIKEIYLDGNRWYEVIQGNQAERFPSVNTILSATESPEAKQRLANWKFKQSQKFFNANRMCANCVHFVDDNCTAGEKLRSIKTKNRCKSFAPTEALLAAKNAHGESARNRGTAVHENIENWFNLGILPTPEICPYSSQITHLLKNLEVGKIFVEKAVASMTHGYSGRVDFCGEYLDQVVVADWVTTDRNYLQRENFERKFLQCAGYAIAIEEMGLAQPTEILVVAMGKNTAELYREPLDKWAELWLKRVEQFWEMQSPEGVPF